MECLGDDICTNPRCPRHGVRPVDSLRDALEKRLETLPVMLFDNGYPTQALPKSELIDLLALKPAEPVGVSDEAVEAAAKAVSVDWQNYVASMRAALEAAQRVQPQVVVSRPTREQIAKAAEAAMLAAYPQSARLAHDTALVVAPAVLNLLGGAK